MGSIASRVSKPLRNWNIENRAHKIISKEKPKPSPMYDSALEQIKLVDKLYPDYKELAKRKDQVLNEHLKSVYVTSDNPEVHEIGQRSNPDRPLPKRKSYHKDMPSEHHKQHEIKPNRIQIHQVIEILTLNKQDPEKYTVAYIATKYKLEKEFVENLLEYYALFIGHNMPDNFDENGIANHVRISQFSTASIRRTEDNESEVVKLRRAYRTEPLTTPIEKQKLY